MYLYTSGTCLKIMFFFENFIFLNVCLLDTRYFCLTTLYIMTIYDMRHRQKKYFCPYTLRIRVSVRENFAKIDDFFQFPPSFSCRNFCAVCHVILFSQKILRKHNLSILHDKKTLSCFQKLFVLKI